MYFSILIGVTIFATLAMTLRDGVWSNTILLMLITLSGLIAFAFYQPVTVLIDEQLNGEYTYALDIVVLWILYSVVFSVLRAVCDALSTTKMKFPGKVDELVGPLVGLLAGCVLAGFLGASLHLAPLPRDGLGGGMDYSGTSIDAAPIYALDAQWLKLVEAAYAAGLAGRAEFDAQEFVDLYGQRRETFDKQEDFRVERK